MFKVEPQFKILPEDTEPLSHVFSKNFHRRQLTNGQKHNAALALYKEEKTKAKKRQQKTHFAGKDANNRPIRKSSVVSNGVPTEENSKKGNLFRAAACPRCYERLMACKKELMASGNLLIKKECPEPCLNFNDD